MDLQVLATEYLWPAPANIPFLFIYPEGFFSTFAF